MLRLLLLLVATTCGLFGADTLRVAAAANLAYVMGPLCSAFERAHPGIHVETTIGASGALYGQIAHGAPFSLFMSADKEYPDRLVKAGLGSQEIVFARGRLVVWSTTEGVPLDDLAAAVRSPKVAKIAIAEPRTAPYGAAAKAALARLGLLADATPKLVVGESIAQTAQYVGTGNAQLGFVPLSYVMAPQAKGKGQWRTVAADLYPPLDHAAVLVGAQQASQAGRLFMEFRKSAEARSVLATYGYLTP